MTMNNRHYQLLIAISTFESQIQALTHYSLENCECFALLQEKLDELSSWILQENPQAISKELEVTPEHDRRIKQLRETTIKALCMLEKHQSQCAREHQLNLSEYLYQLSENTKIELKNAGIGNNSRVLFIGSGSYPISAFTISQFTGAVVHGLDIDEQAVTMANQLDLSHLSTTFSCKDLITEFVSFRPTHVVIASLVEHKWELLKQLQPHLNRSHRILVRFGNGLKSAFNYPFNPNLIEGWGTKLIPNDTAIYDTVLMERAE
ncbi:MULTISPECIES: nicotianamine synthase family protein [Vibrio]|uniref:nicotianamine synthase family protein n=1 Tax=Vibrio TaxID=662 RepID=UPI001493C994|nr:MULTISPECIES: nicotianamine synthase family protein [Vibrio]MDN3632983.1 nicotianamine synthase family protein [Vibrio lentus]NOI87902.1 hypothetical protein [Vibrio sp. 99K-1]NOI96706.1 hypothetical protein [Vibrio sp. T3Y01]